MGASGKDDAHFYHSGRLQSTWFGMYTCRPTCIQCKHIESSYVREVKKERRREYLIFELRWITEKIGNR